MRDDTVTGLLQDDHTRLDDLIDEARSALSARAFADASALWRQVVHGLGQHIEAEEQLLFPAFERATGMTSGPTVVMRNEHVDIKRLLETVGAALGAEDASAARAAVAELADLLGVHNSKEEGILYPRTDSALGPAGAKALTEQLRARLGSDS